MAIPPVSFTEIPVFLPLQTGSAFPPLINTICKTAYKYRKITLFIVPIIRFLQIIGSFPFINRDAFRRKYRMQKPFIHDPAIYKDPVTGRYYIYATHAEGYVSDDLLHWDSLGVRSQLSFRKPGNGQGELTYGLPI